MSVYLSVYVCTCIYACTCVMYAHIKRERESEWGVPRSSSHFQALCHCIALTWRLHQTVESLLYTSLGNLCRQRSPSCTCTKYLSKNFMSPSLPTHLAKGAPTIQTHLIYSLPCLLRKSIQRGKRLTMGWLALSFGQIKTMWSHWPEPHPLSAPVAGCWPRSPQGRLGREARVPWRPWCPERPEMLKTISWRTWLAIIIEEASLNKEPLDLCRWYMFYIIYIKYTSYMHKYLRIYSIQCHMQK